ncbi:MAG TPA: AraC family ligand binding domain-containing protein [Acidobacteriaceae bacterium]|jgi:quercetin dioxygenase-like cupin family protein|nr:AraC family ligand binding domain-containing protein [Acidobacteriaceae bacterium]
MPTSQLDGTMLDKQAEFDLPREIAEAQQKKPWAAGHYAKTLFKKHDLRILLITMEDAAHMKEHHADGTLSVQVLRGRLRLNVAGKPHELAEGSLFTLAGSIRHDIQSVGDSAFLLTLSWPRPEELAAMKHRGYGT